MSAERPAPGYRYHSIGTPGYLGNYGFCWSSATNSILGMYLCFNTADLYPRYEHYRGRGLQLRCLSE
ncbi:hypothetical protein [uncultured Rikenella sp.]|uniref:hypothetical protein n=1 Tax=uncultured Rikenella sp. TaxID=368003 RepID=UPI0025E4A6CF|nr:hypothetical protein [uncultured Rikenella sp.]